MGQTATKLVDFDQFRRTVISQEERILALGSKRITELDAKTSIAEKLQVLVGNIRVGEGETRLVSGSKTIHHFLPDLMPPIDRQYTLAFFYNSTNPLHIDSCLSEIYPYFVEIAIANRDTIRRMVGKGFHTGEAKVIDNAIVGYVLKKGLK